MCHDLVYFMTINEVFLSLFTPKRVLKLFFQCVYFFCRHAKNINDMLSIPFMRSVFFLIFKIDLLLPSFFKKFFLVKMFEGHLNRIFWSIKVRIWYLRMVNQVELKGINKFSGPLGFFLLELFWVKKSSVY